MPTRPTNFGLLPTVLRNPRAVLGLSLVAVLVAAAMGTQVELRTSRSELAPPDDPDQARWTRLLEEYSGTEALIACVEAADLTTDAATDTTASRRAYADRFAQVVSGDPRIANVFHRVDVDWFLDHGLWLAPVNQLQAAIGALEAEPELFGNLSGLGGWTDLNNRIAARIERGLIEGGAVPGDGGQAEGLLARFAGGQRSFLANPTRTVDDWTARSLQATLASAADASAAADGYLETDDGQTTFVVITQKGADDTLEHRRALVAALRGHADAVSLELPGFRVALTGQPAMVVDEMDAIGADSVKTSLVAALGVALLTLMVFRWRSHAILVLAALAAGIVWSLGAVLVEFGYLNLITSSFISTLVGVGVAYGIHPVSEYELCGAHTGDPSNNVLEAYRRTGAGITVAAVTTSAAFFSILLMRFKGFAELGLVAGVGVLLCLLAATTTLPALLLTYGRWRRQRERQPGQPGKQSSSREVSSAVDRFWLEAAAGQVTRFPGTVTVAALVITVLAGWSATSLRFDTNLLDLLPRDAESLRYQRRLFLESDLSPLYNIVVAEDVEQLKALEASAGHDPELIARFDSVLRFLPEDPQASARALARLGPHLDALTLTEDPGVLDREGLRESLVRLEAALADAGEAAFIAGLADLAGPLEQARSEIESAIDLVASAEPAAVQAWGRAEQRLWVWVGEGVAWLQRAAAVEAPTIDTLPEEVRQRFVTQNGRLLGFLYPAVNVFEKAPLAEYVAASKRVSAEATGFPLVFDKMSGRIVSGFKRAVGAGALVVLLILALDFRNLRNALLAMVPLLMGTIWMLGGMRLLGISFNFANLVAVPLIIGVGIDNGVHVIHRVRLEGQAGITVVLRHTGRAILIASLTTMIGFGSLSLASHRGMSSLGLVLLLGVGACLITSTIVLPNLLVVSGQIKR